MPSSWPPASPTEAKAGSPRTLPTRPPRGAGQWHECPWRRCQAIDRSSMDLHGLLRGIADRWTPSRDRSCATTDLALRRIRGAIWYRKFHLVPGRTAVGAPARRTVGAGCRQQVVGGGAIPLAPTTFNHPVSTLQPPAARLDGPARGGSSVLLIPGGPDVYTMSVSPKVPGAPRQPACERSERATRARRSRSLCVGHELVAPAPDSAGRQTRVLVRADVRSGASYPGRSPRRTPCARPA